MSGVAKLYAAENVTISTLIFTKHSFTHSFWGHVKSHIKNISGHFLFTLDAQQVLKGVLCPSCSVVVGLKS